MCWSVKAKETTVWWPYCECTLCPFLFKSLTLIKHLKNATTFILPEQNTHLSHDPPVALTCRCVWICKERAKFLLCSPFYPLRLTYCTIKVQTTGVTVTAVMHFRVKRSSVVVTLASHTGKGAKFSMSTLVSGFYLCTLGLAFSNTCDSCRHICCILTFPVRTANKWLWISVCERSSVKTDTCLYSMWDLTGFFNCPQGCGSQYCARRVCFPKPHPWCLL